MSFTALCHQIFPAVIDEYHRYDDVDHPIANPYREDYIEHLLYLKNWIDTVQWHLEDLIRDPQIDPVEALVLKRRIDRSNQERTDMVEYIDSYFLDKFGGCGDRVRCENQYREPGLGDRPAFDSRAENLSHGPGGEADRRVRETRRRVPA